jgi:hypothetical protein
MTDEQKKEIVKNGLEFVHCAIQEAMNGNMDELMTALEVLELMREEGADHAERYANAKTATSASCGGRRTS